MPDVHLHSLEGALISIAVMWRLPIVHSSDSEQSLRMLRCIADQVRGPQERSYSDSIGSRNASHRDGSSCCRDYRASVPLSRIDCSVASDPSKVSVLQMQPNSRRSVESAQRRRRVSASWFADVHPTPGPTDRLGLQPNRRARLGQCVHTWYNVVSRACGRNESVSGS